jgi:hypothetical protein
VVTSLGRTFDVILLDLSRPDEMAKILGEIDLEANLMREALDHQSAKSSAGP